MKGLATEYNSWSLKRDSEEREWKTRRRAELMRIGQEMTENEGEISDGSDEDEDEDDDDDDSIEITHNEDVSGPYGKPRTAHLSPTHSEVAEEHSSEDETSPSNVSTGIGLRNEGSHQDPSSQDPSESVNKARYRKVMGESRGSDTSWAQTDLDDVDEQERETDPHTYSVPQLEGVTKKETFHIIDNYVPDGRGANKEKADDYEAGSVASSSTSCSMRQYKAASSRFQEHLKQVDREETEKQREDSRLAKKKIIYEMEQKEIRQFWKYEPMVKKIYAEYNPSKLDEVPLIMKHFQGRLHHLITALKEKYDVVEDDGDEIESSNESSYDSDSDSGDEPFY